MLENAKLYLEKKVASLDLERARALATIQVALDKNYPKLARAKSLNEGVLKVVTTSGAVAGDLRIKQVELMKRFSEETGRHIERLQIQIAQVE